MGRIGYWISEKKRKKLNFDDFEVMCRQDGLEVVKIDLDRPLEEQGPFHVIFHKLTDTITYAERGEKDARNQIHNLKVYLAAHPDVVLLDPLVNIRQLQDRHEQYRLVQECQHQHNDSVFFTPPFVEFTSTDIETNYKLLKHSQVTFPFVCKPSIAHGSKVAHKMSIIFNETGLKDVRPPCVAQSFINHNAILYKIYVIGDQDYIVERPSLKNFKPGDQDTIFFDSHDVSKADSASFLNKLEPGEQRSNLQIPDRARLSQLARSIQSKMQLTLFGVDVIVENATGRYAVIDINAFPGYDGVPEFFQVLCQFLKHCVKCRKNGHSILPTFQQQNGDVNISHPYQDQIIEDRTYSISKGNSIACNGVDEGESLGQNRKPLQLTKLDCGEPNVANGHAYLSTETAVCQH